MKKTQSRYPTLRPRQMTLLAGIQVVYRPIELEIDCGIVTGRHGNIRFQTLTMNAAIVGREPVGNRHAQLRTVAEPINLLDRPFAKRLHANQLAPPPVLNRSGDNFRGAGRPAVDKDGHGDILRDAVVVRSEHALVAGFVALVQHYAVLQENVRHGDRLIEKAAGIAAQIENQALWGCCSATSE